MLLTINPYSQHLHLVRGCGQIEVAGRVTYATHGCSPQGLRFVAVIISSIRPVHLKGQVTRHMSTMGYLERPLGLRDAVLAYHTIGYSRGSHIKWVTKPTTNNQLPLQTQTACMPTQVVKRSCTQQLLCMLVDTKPLAITLHNTCTVSLLSKKWRKAVHFQGLHGCSGVARAAE